MLALGFLVMYVPTYQALADHVWTITGQGHGPVMLALTAWLIWKRLPQLQNLTGPPATLAQGAGAASLLLGLAMYVLGRSQNHMGFHVVSLFFVLLGFLLIYGGWQAGKAMWFPLFFSLTLVPLPGTLVGELTGPLKISVSYVTELLLHYAGFPVGRSGVILTVGPYVLMVADACFGLNSILTLEAVGIFYLSLVNYSNKLRGIVLAILILPISFVSNVIRVMALVLVTYFFGDHVGQGFIHEFAGIFIFVVAILLTVSVDQLLGVVIKNDSAV